MTAAIRVRPRSLQTTSGRATTLLNQGEPGPPPPPDQQQVDSDQLTCPRKPLKLLQASTRLLLQHRQERRFHSNAAANLAGAELTGSVSQLRQVTRRALLHVHTRKNRWANRLQPRSLMATRGHRPSCWTGSLPLHKLVLWSCCWVPDYQDGAPASDSGGRARGSRASQSIQLQQLARCPGNQSISPLLLP